MGYKIYEFVSFVICISIVLITVFILFKPLKSSSDYFRRAIVFQTLFHNRKKAIKLLNGILSLNDLKDQDKYNALFYLGELYFELKDYNRSCDMFDKAYEMVKDEKFCYREYHNTMIKAYFLAGRTEKALGLYHNFLERQSYDLGFNHIKKLSKLYNLEVKKQLVSIKENNP